MQSPTHKRTAWLIRAVHAALMILFPIGEIHEMGIMYVHLLFDFELWFPEEAVMVVGDDALLFVCVCTFSSLNSCVL